ncbi:MAG: hypothetical protein AB8E82_03420 [Aureispira sp.]
MNFDKISSTRSFNAVGVLVVGGLTLGTIIPANLWFNEYLASHALLVMLFFLISGFMGLIWRKNTVILFNFMACIAVCSFLKEQGISTTAEVWHRPTQPTVRVANLNLRESDDLMVLQQRLADSRVDFLSLNIAPTIEFPTQTLELLKKRLPYYKIINTKEENRTLVFSNYKIEALDTFHYTGNKSISIVGTLAMQENQMVPFISTNIPVKDYELPEAQQHWTNLSQYMTRQHSQVSTASSYNNVHLTAWEPAIQALCSAKNVSDQSEYSPMFLQPEYLFYAENLICKQVEDLLEGHGAVATYEFVETSFSRKPNFSETLRGGAAL